jgi:hypothetical protein
MTAATKERWLTLSLTAHEMGHAAIIFKQFPRTDEIMISVLSEGCCMSSPLSAAFDPSPEQRAESAWCAAAAAFSSRVPTTPRTVEELSILMTTIARTYPGRCCLSGEDIEDLQHGVYPAAMAYGWRLGKAIRSERNAALMKVIMTAIAEDCCFVLHRQLFTYLFNAPAPKPAAQGEQL